MQYGMSAEQHRIKWAACPLWWDCTACTSTHKRENKAWARVCADKSWVDGCVWTFTPLHRQSGRGARVMQAQAEANSHFPASKKPAALKCLKSWQPRLSLCSAGEHNLTQNPLRGSCQRRLPGIAFCSVSAFMWKSEHCGHLSVALAEWAYRVSMWYSLQVQLLQQNDWDWQKAFSHFLPSACLTSFYCPRLN